MNKPVAPKVRTLTGGCHCGAVRFEIETALDDVLQCNCSICSRRAWLHVIEPRQRFRLLTEASALTEYRFGTGVARHLFCATCGVAAHYVPRSHPDGVSVNARCLDGLDLATLPVRPFDGQNWEENISHIR